MISDKAVIQTDSNNIGSNVRISEFAIVRPDVMIGENSIIHPNVVIESGVEIGKNVEIFPGAYLGKEPKGAGATARTPVFERKVLINDNCSIGPNAVIFYNVTIGENTLLGDGASIREKCIVGSFCIISRYVTINYNTTIGNHTKIMDLTHITGNTIIEDNVFISTMVGMTNDNFDTVGYSDDQIVGPRIKKNVAIAAGVTILPKVEIGEGAIVGAGAVVTKNVEPHQIVMGVPARFVRSVNN
jgi:acetyltransferase-like isoleucine patch superfamily enzyme